MNNNNRARYSETVRIVQIDTHFVETDALNFRAVVQSLTGKNSAPVWGGNEPSALPYSLVAAAEAGGVEAVRAGKCDDNDIAGFHGVVVAVKPGDGDGDDQGMVRIKGQSKYEDDDYVLSFMKTNNLSFNDFDRLLSEFALMEELPLL